MTQLKDRVELIKLEVKQATDEQHKLAEVTKSLLPKQYQREVATLPRWKRFLGAIAALGTSAGLILGDPLKEAACTAASIFAFLTCAMIHAVCPKMWTSTWKRRKKQKRPCNVSSRLMMKTSSYWVTKSERHKKNVKNLRDAVSDHLQVLKDRMSAIQLDLIQHKECQRRQAQHSLFLQETRCVISHLGTLYTHIKSYQAAFYA